MIQKGRANPSDYVYRQGLESMFQVS